MAKQSRDLSIDVVSSTMEATSARQDNTRRGDEDTSSLSISHRLMTEPAGGILTPKVKAQLTVMAKRSRMVNPKILTQSLNLQKLKQSDIMSVIRKGKNPHPIKPVSVAATIRHVPRAATDNFNPLSLSIDLNPLLSRDSASRQTVGPLSQQSSLSPTSPISPTSIDTFTRVVMT